MYGARTVAVLGAAAVCLGISGCAGVSAEIADAARQESAALRVDVRAGEPGAAEAQGDRLSAYAEAAGGTAEPASSAAAHQGARLSAYADAWAAVTG
ncbi:hypothetical protein [Agromyces sp. ZXT2-6]|uniref:hypothetical protein n=1 Tax=Agromyces sp. ZXT2-6 TaxID=3461153 RepID=UPI00405509E4